jgi:hypothetical protein
VPTAIPLDVPAEQIRSRPVSRRTGTGRPVTTEPRLRLLEAHQASLREQIARLRAHGKALAAKIATYRDDLAAFQAQQQNGTEND